MSHQVMRLNRLGIIDLFNEKVGACLRKTKPRKAFFVASLDDLDP